MNNEEGKKTIWMHLTIALVTAFIITASCIATLAHLAGEIRADHRHLSQVVDK